MPAETKKAPAPRPSSLVSLTLGWVQQGMDSFLATQRILVDFATKKNASLMNNLREGVYDSEHSPVAILTELAVEATANFSEAQKLLLNLVQQENEIILTGVKERVGGFPMAVIITDRLRRGIDTVVEMQQDFLTMAGKQVRQRLEAAQAGKGLNISDLADAARDAMENFVHAQKKFLDILVLEDAKAKGGESPKNATAISKLAREAADAFIDTQKKLLDLVGQQMNVNLQTTSKAVDMVKSFRPPLSLPSLAGEQAKNFIAAEKTLIDSLSKPGNGAKPAKRITKKRPVRKAAAVTQTAHAGA